MATEAKAAHHDHETLSDAKRDAPKRLSYVDGHLAGIRGMVAQDKYCVDILTQTRRLRRAIRSRGCGLRVGRG